MTRVVPMLSTFLSLAEEIHADLASGDAAGASFKLKRLLETDSQIQDTAAALLLERDLQLKTRKLLDSAEAQQSSLLQLAGRMRAAESRLSESIERARDAL